jgi:hypothetical protein
MTHKTHTFSPSERAFLVNSFVLEGERSVVVIDTEFLVSSVPALRAKLDAIGKPLAALSGSALRGSAASFRRYSQ